MEVLSKSPLETKELGKALGNLLNPGNILALIGDLGSGKTTFVQGISQALHITIPVNSPSFLIIKEYKGKHRMLHIDVYRLKIPERELENIGFEEYLNSDFIIVIEWADKIRGLLPKERMEIIFEHVDFNERLIKFKPYGEKYENLLLELKKCLSLE